MTSIIYFWKPAQPDGYLSNWYSSPFTVEGIKFSCSEQYFMFMKARHFGDHDIAQRILLEFSAVQMKELGKKVRGFNTAEWDRVKTTYMYQGCLEKFKANRDLARRLVATGDAILAEASPYDIVWGIGLNVSQATAGVSWRGQNLLGKILMEVRKDIIHC